MPGHNQPYQSLNSDAQRNLIFTSQATVIKALVKQFEDYVKKINKYYDDGLISQEDSMQILNSIGVFATTAIKIIAGKSLRDENKNNKNEEKKNNRITAVKTELEQINIFRDKLNLKEIETYKEKIKRQIEILQKRQQEEIKHFIVQGLREESNLSRNSHDKIADDISRLRDMINNIEIASTLLGDVTNFEDLCNSAIDKARQKPSVHDRGTTRNR